MEDRIHRNTRRGVPVFLALLIIGVLAVSALAGCSSSTPELTVKDFISARMEGNESRAEELTVEGDLKGYLGGEPFLAGSEADFTAELVESDKDRAVVLVRFSWGEEGVDISYVCRRAKSRWKVSLRETEALWYPEIELKEQGTDAGS
ncbi:MAG: hypothetical protein H5T73_09280 [Actinobacteria bacterium]|nr:hypothetical protein [Actinomycetota bacterium]